MVYSGPSPASPSGSKVERVKVRKVKFTIRKVTLGAISLGGLLRFDTSTWLPHEVTLHLDPQVTKQPPGYK